ncbi:MAG: hypothetical protein JOZ47_06015 [Kutzneria sp.]|nr:hypothetical protein [Kutzneria sp.]
MSVTDVDRTLTELRRHGFTFQPVWRDGELDLIIGFRGWEGCTDRIEIRAESEATAVRERHGEGFGPASVTWTCTGRMVDVAEAVTALPVPEDQPTGHR